MKAIKAWISDADNIDPNTIPEWFIFQNYAIKQYLDVYPGSHEKELFLVGAKGTGKSLLIRYKAFLYSQRITPDSNILLATDQNDLVHKLNFSIHDLQEDNLNQLSELRVWEKLWKFTLYITLLRKNKIDLPPHIQFINKDFPEDYSDIDFIITTCLNNSKKFLLSNYLKRCLPTLQALIKTIQHGNVLFIDKLDQALNSLFKDPRYNQWTNKKGENLAFITWQNAQFGLLKTSYELSTTTNAHIKVFATARPEALTMDNPIAQNIKSYITLLEYHKKDIKEMFLSNISLMQKEGLIRPKAKNLIEQFLGFAEIKHIQSEDYEGNKDIEDVFCFLYRHTLQRPRGMMFLGGALSKFVSSEDYKELAMNDKIEKCRRLVNNESHNNLLGFYSGEIIPEINDSHIDELTQKIKQNVIPAETMQKVSDQAKNYLYKLGLLGVLDNNNKQYFERAAKHVYSKLKLPNARFYFVHPILDQKLLNTHSKLEFLNQHNIIGYGAPFREPPLLPVDIWNKRPLKYFLPKDIAGKKA